MTGSFVLVIACSFPAKLHTPSTYEESALFQQPLTMAKGKGAGSFNNAGTLIKWGLGPSTIEIQYNDQGGTVKGNEGTLTFKQKTSLLNGTVETAPKAIVLMGDNFDQFGGTAREKTGTLKVGKDMKQQQGGVTEITISGTT